MKNDSISRQAAADVVDFECGEWRGLAKIIIDKLETLPSTQPEHNPDDERKIADLHKMVNYLLSQLEQRWIPCSERLPEEKEKSYWVCCETGGQCQCRWTNDMYGLGTNKWSKWGWHIMDKPQYSKIIAWMPLPESYREEGDES